LIYVIIESWLYLFSRHSSQYIYGLSAHTGLQSSCTAAYCLPYPFSILRPY
jgi:hypothetical protein